MRPSTLLLALLLHLRSRDLLTADGTSFFDEEDTEYVDTVSLRDVTPHSVRSRRSAGAMPDDLHLHFRTGRHDVALRLRRSEHIDAGRVPVYTVGDDQELVKAELPRVTEAAVYRDIHRSAAILVKRQHRVGDVFHLHGTLSVGDKQHTISPSSPVPPQGAHIPAMSHVLRAIQSNDSYGMDYVDIDEDNSEQFRIGESGEKKRAKRQTTRVANIIEENTSARRKTARHNIDINMVCDHACFKRFYKRHDKNETRALEEARLYFSYLAQSVDVRFRTISEVSPGLLVTVTPISVITSKTAKGSRYSEKRRVKGSSSGVDGNKVLKSFRHWVSTVKLPKAAITVLQTGYNMMSNGDRKRVGQVGIAYRGGACSRNGVVVVEEKFHGITGMITAHEMGHNVNAKHDGSYSDADGKCARDMARYVMSMYIGVPQGSSKPWTFSPCSAEAIAKFVSKKGDKCFPDNYEKIITENAGQTYSADNQCAISLGTGYYFCRGHQYQTAVGFEGMCTKMYCSRSPTRGNTCTAIVPFEYTSCGHKKWCVQGKCVYNKRAPSKVKDTCPQGDDPSYECSRSKSCSPFPFLPRNVYCCQTCFGPVTSLVTGITASRLPTLGSLSNRARSSNAESSRRAAGFITTLLTMKRNSASSPTSAKAIPSPATTTSPTTMSTATTTRKPTTTSTVPSSTTTTLPPKTPAPTTTTTRRRTAVVTPSICRESRFWCQVCVRWNFRFSFCRT